jgi:hypothetical protein
MEKNAGNVTFMGNDFPGWWPKNAGGARGVRDTQPEAGTEALGRDSGFSGHP